MGLTSVFCGTIHRVGSIYEFAEVLSVCSKHLYTPIEDTKALSEEDKQKGVIRYRFIKDLMLEEFSLEAKTSPEKNYNDKKTNGFVINVFYDIGTPDYSYFKGLEDTFEVFGMSEYTMSSEFDENKFIEKKFEKANCISKYQDSYNAYLGRDTSTMGMIASIYGGGKMPLYDLVANIQAQGRYIPTIPNNVYNVVDKAMRTTIDAKCKECEKKWKPSVYKDFYGTKEIDFFGLYTNVSLFLLYVYNAFEFELGDVEESKEEFKVEYVKGYMALVEKTFSKREDKLKYTKGIIPVLKEYMTKEEYAKLKTA